MNILNNQKVILLVVGILFLFALGSSVYLFLENQELSNNIVSLEEKIVMLESDAYGIEDNQEVDTEEEVAITPISEDLPEKKIEYVSCSSYTSKIRLTQNDELILWLVPNKNDGRNGMRIGEYLVEVKSNKVEENCVYIKGEVASGEEGKIASTSIAEYINDNYILTDTGTSTCRSSNVINLSKGEKTETIARVSSGMLMYLTHGNTVFYNNCESFDNRQSVLSYDLSVGKSSILYKSSTLEEYWLKSIDGDILIIEKKSVVNSEDWSDSLKVKTETIRHELN